MNKLDRAFAWWIGFALALPITMVIGFTWAYAIGNPEAPPWPDGVLIMTGFVVVLALIATPIRYVAARWWLS